MTGLSIGVIARQVQALSGESLMAEAMFVNDGPGDAEIPSPNDPSPFAYELSPERGGRRTVVSQELFSMTVARNPRPPRDPGPPLALAPGRMRGRVEDIAEWSPEPFMPGLYNLTAHCRLGDDELSSPFARVRVATPRIESFASCLGSRRGGLATVIAHRRVDGGLVVLQREGRALMHQYGVFYRRAAFPAGTPGCGLAVAADAEEPLSGRWFARLQENQISADLGWGRSVTVTAEPFATGLENARLVQPGFQFADASALFLVTGESRGGNRVRQFRASPKEGWRMTGDVPFRAGALPALRARYSGGRVQVAWRDQNSLQICPIESDALLPPIVAFRPAEPLLAWEFAPSSLCAIVGRVDDGFVRCRQLDMEASDRSEPRRLVLPSEPVERWAIAEISAGDFWVAAATASQVLIARAGAGRWSTLEPDAKDIRSLHVFNSDGAHGWAEWVDPRYGVQRRLIPSL